MVPHTLGHVLRQRRIVYSEFDTDDENNQVEKFARIFLDSSR